MPVSESEKLGVSLLGSHFSEKAEHIPIKKRRFLYRASSPPCDTTNPSLEGEERHSTCSKDSSHKLQSNPSATCLSEAVTEICQRGSNVDKLDENELMKTTRETGEHDDFSGISVLAGAACSDSFGAEADGCKGPGTVLSMMKSPKAMGTVELEENNANSINICNEESHSHTSTTPPKGVASSTNDHSSLDESMLDSSLQVPVESSFSNRNLETSMIQKSSAQDVRLNWDLNTVMDDWEEPLVSEHEVSASEAAAHHNVTFVEERKNDCTKVNSGDCKLGNERESGSLSKNISTLNLSVELKSWAPDNEDLKLGNQNSDGSAEIHEPSCHEFDSAQHSGVEETASLHDKHIDSNTGTLTLEKPSYGTSGKWMNLAGRSSSGLGRTEAVNTQLSMEYSIPPGFDHCLNLLSPKENAGVSSISSTIVGPGNNIKFPTITTQTSRSESEKHDLSLSTAAISSIHDAESPLQNGFGYDNSQSDNRAGSGFDKLDEISVGYDSQYEDGELRESTIHAWKGYDGNEGENEYVMDNRGDDINLGTMDVLESSSHCGQEGSSGIKQPEVGSGRNSDLISNVMLPEKIHSSEVSGSGPKEIINGQGNIETQDIVQHASQSDEWKMSVSGWDALPENPRISSTNFAKTRNLSSRKFSYREPNDGFETKEVEMKAEGSRFYRKESLTHIGRSSTRDVCLSRDRFRMQGCSSKAADGFTSRSERESGVLRSFERGRYSPPRSRGSGRGGGMWNRSSERVRDLKRLPSPSYQGPSFLRSGLEDVGSADHMTNEAGMDLSDAGRPNTSSYLTRRLFRSRSPMDREAIEFRKRLGLRSTGDTSHDRILNMGRGRGQGRPVRYGTRLDGEEPRGRYHDECDEFVTEYSHSHPFPRKHRCFSRIERGGNNSYAHHQSDSISPSRPRTRSPVANNGFSRRSRSPNFRPDTRMPRLRSPNYRCGFEPDHASEYNSGPRNNNSSPTPSSRWVHYKERTAVFDRRSPPPGRTDGMPGERFSFYDSSRKPKLNGYYRSGHPGRFSDLNEAGRGRPRYMGTEGERLGNGYRRGGFIRRYDMDEHAKRFQYEDEDSVGQGFVKVWTNS